MLKIYSKLNPAAGAGALSAIQDAVTLANWICALQTKKVPELEMAFKEYKAERFPVIKEAFATRQLFKSMGAKVHIQGHVSLVWYNSTPSDFANMLNRYCNF